jgi:Tat protein secretion system quality control protein TatD with DNase activity
LSSGKGERIRIRGRGKRVLVRMSASSKSKKKEFPEGAFFKGSGDFILSLPSVDIGANLLDDAYEKDVDEVLVRAQRAGLKAIVVTGTSLKASERAIAFAETKSNAELEVFATVGIHPHDAKSCSEHIGATMKELRLLAGHPKCVAVGECGLDFDRNFSPQDVQRKVFEQQVQLAKELGKPLFMHCRDAAKDLEEIIKRLVTEISAARIPLQQPLYLSLSDSFRLMLVVHSPNIGTVPLKWRASFIVSRARWRRCPSLLVSACTSASRVGSATTGRAEAPA